MPQPTATINLRITYVGATLGTDKATSLREVWESVKRRPALAQQAQCLAVHPAAMDDALLAADLPTYLILAPSLAQGIGAVVLAYEDITENPNGPTTTLR